MSDSFKNWLLTQVREVLSRLTMTPSLLLWCDSHHEWLDLLREVAATDGFDLWALENNGVYEHGLVVRDRFFTAE